MKRSDIDWSLTRRQLWTLFLVGLLLGATPGVPALMAAINDGYSVSPGVTYRASNGPAVEVQQNMDIESGNPFPDSNTFELVSSNGNVTFISQGHANASLDTVTGPWTNVSQLDVASATLTINPEDKQSVEVGGDADHLYFTDMAVDDGSVDFEYGGASGTTTLTVHNLQSNTEIGAVDVDTGVVLDSATSDGSGTLSLSLPNSNHTVELTTEGLDSGTPQISDPSPTGAQSNEPSELSVQINDTDFPSGDTVTTTFYLNGTQYGTDSLSSNGTATVSVGNISTGQHEWYVEAEDSYGRSERSSTYEFSTPDQLLIKNESNPSQLVDDTAVTVQFFEEDGSEVFERTTSNGTLDLSGLPATKTYIVTATAEGYFDRTIILKSLAEQHSIYLVPENETTVEVRFTLTDNTQQFPKESTRLYVQMPLTENGSTTYKTVVADEFQAQGVTADLRKGERYRLIVENQDGEQRVLGSHTADVSEEVPLVIDEIVYDVDDEYTGYMWDASMTGDEGDKQIEFSFQDYALDPSNVTEDLHVRIYQRDDESNVIYDQTQFGDVESFKLTQPLNATQSNETWVVEWEAERNGEQIDGKRYVGPGQKDLLSGLDQLWKNVVAVGLLLIVGFLFSPANAGIGTVAISVTGGFLWFIGFLPPEVGGPAAVLALLVSMIFRTNKKGGYPA